MRQETGEEGDELHNTKSHEQTQKMGQRKDNNNVVSRGKTQR